jgi:hypothetical protein
MIVRKSSIWFAIEMVPEIYPAIPNVEINDHLQRKMYFAIITVHGIDETGTEIGVPEIVFFQIFFPNAESIFENIFLISA